VSKKAMKLYKGLTRYSNNQIDKW